MLEWYIARIGGYPWLNLKSRGWVARLVSGTLNTYEETMENHLLENRDYNLWVRLHQARDVIFRARDKELSRYSITPMQAAVLFIVKVLKATEGEATPGKVSRWLLREPHTISRIVTRMEDEGLVSKIRGSGKKNEINITLTEKGEQAYRQSSKRESIREIMSCLSEEERQQLDSSLEKLRNRGSKTLTRQAKCLSRSVGPMRTSICIQ